MWPSLLDHFEEFFLAAKKNSFKKFQRIRNRRKSEDGKRLQIFEWATSIGAPSRKLKSLHCKLPHFTAGVAPSTVIQAYFALHETLPQVQNFSEKNIFWY
jgi:hypothetical protein